MTQFTPNLNLTKPGGGSTGTNTPPDRADIDVLNDNFDKIDTAVGDPDEQNRQWYGPAASIGTLPESPKDGDTYQESDGNKMLWIREGGVWITNEGGMFLIRPSSVSGTGTSITATGAVALAANTPQCFVNGVFSSRFRRYLILVTLDAASADSNVFLGLRNAGAAVGTAQCFWVQTENTQTTGPTRSASTAQNHIGGLRAGADGAIIRYELQNPGHAERKFVLAESFSTDMNLRELGGQIIISTAADGFSFGTQGAPTVTGSLKVYGLA